MECKYKRIKMEQPTAGCCRYVVIVGNTNNNIVLNSVKRTESPNLRNEMCIGDTK